MKARARELEIMDDFAVPAAELERSLDFIVFVNRFFGGTRTVLDYFESRETPAKFSVLDIGCGAGDIPFALDRWTASKGKEAEITAIDLNPRCLDYAKRHFSSPRVRFLAHSAFDIGTLGSFDYIISSMFFHHLEDDDIVRLLKLVDSQSTRGFLVNDLYRGHLNYVGASLLSALSFQKIVWNDARLSVRRAFQEKDFYAYRRNTGISFRFERKPIFRIVISHDKHPH